MGDKCHIGNCDNTSYDNCSVCRKPTCKKHGRSVGDRFVCRQCADRA